MEYKGTEEAKSLESQILEARQALKQKRMDLREQTEALNNIKAEIDQVKSFLDQKTEQKKQHAITQAMAPGFSSPNDALDDIPNEINEVIDEEELAHLRELKELKKHYRTAYKELKDSKNESNFNQQAIDSLK